MNPQANKDKGDSFYQKCSDAIKNKNSILIAGLDPAVFEMGHGKYSLLPNVDKLKWSLDYLKAVAEFCVGVKINLAFWQGEKDISDLSKIIEWAISNKMLVIFDGKYSDISSTNDAWMFFAEKRALAVTIAAYAGNIEESIQIAHKRGLGVFTMGLMSNPEFREEIDFTNSKGEPLYVFRAKRALQSKVDGFVLGPNYSPNELILKTFLKTIGLHKVFYLVPGIGAQKGTIKNVSQYGIDLNHCLINVSRGLMFPEGESSKPSDQNKAAHHFFEQINTYRRQ